MTVADAIAQWFAEKGFSHAFGIIGGGNVALFDAIARLKKTQIVCTHHEQAAAMAATYFYRTSGALAPVLVTTGAGSTNAITGVMAAFMDSVPLLVISGNEASKYMGAPTRIHGVQGYDSSGLASGFAKWSYRITGADTAIRLLDGMLDCALKPRQGPCWMDIPKDVQNMEAA